MPLLVLKPSEIAQIRSKEAEWFDANVAPYFHGTKMLPEYPGVHMVAYNVMSDEVWNHAVDLIDEDDEDADEAAES